VNSEIASGSGVATLSLFRLWNESQFRVGLKVKATISLLDDAAGATFHVIPAWAALSARTGLPPIMPTFATVAFASTRRAVVE